jgi:hypothetical protein
MRLMLVKAVVTFDGGLITGNLPSGLVGPVRW